MTEKQDGIAKLSILLKLINIVCNLFSIETTELQNFRRWKSKTNIAVSNFCRFVKRSKIFKN